MPLRTVTFFIFYIQDTCLQSHNHKQEVMFVTSGFIVPAELAIGSHINDEKFEFMRKQQ